MNLLHGQSMLYDHGTYSMIWYGIVRLSIARREGVVGTTIETLMRSKIRAQSMSAWAGSAKPNMSTS